MPPGSPPAITKEIPISTPDFYIVPSRNDSVQQSLPAWLPSAQKPDRAIPSRVVQRTRAMHLVAISERHIDQRLADGFIGASFIGLAIQQHVELPHRRVHQPVAFPFKREIRVRSEMNQPCP